MSLNTNRSTLINFVAGLKVSLTILHFCDLKFDMILQGVILYGINKIIIFHNVGSSIYIYIALYLPKNIASKS